MSSQVVRVDALRSIAAASISGTYNPIGGSFTHPMRLLKILNNTNLDVFISFDGTTDNDYIPANSFTLYDCNTNKNLPDSRFVFANGTQLYARTSGATPSTSSVFVVAIFGQGD